MYSFAAYRRTVNEIIHRLKINKYIQSDAQANLLRFLCHNVIQQSSNPNFAIPLAEKETFDSLMDIQRNKLHIPYANLRKIVEEMDLWTKLYLLKIEGATMQEEKVLYLIEKFILLYKQEILFTDTAFGLISEVNKMEGSTWAIKSPDEVLERTS